MTTLINPYKDAHKGIRHLLVDLLVQCGKTDPGDAEQLQGLYKCFVKVQDLLEIHSQIEDQLLAPMIRACGGEKKLDAIEAAHLSLNEQTIALSRQLDALLSQGADAASFQKFYLALSRYAAEQLQHMADEEVIIWPALSQSCEDEQMLEFQASARRMAPPVVMQTLLGAIISSTNESERRLMLGGMQKSLPEESFARVCELSKSVLPSHEWDSLGQFLGLAVTA